MLNALVTSLEHEISTGGGALVASLPPSRVLQLFSGSVYRALVFLEVRRTPED